MKQLYREVLDEMTSEELFKETTDIAYQSMYILGGEPLEDNDPLRSHACHWQLLCCAEEWSKREHDHYMDIVDYVYDSEFGINNYTALEIDNV